MTGFWIGLAIVGGCGVGIWIVQILGALQAKPPIELTAQQRDRLAELAATDRRTR